MAETDRFNQPFVAVVSASFAERYWPGQDPLGKRFQFAFSERTVVGVVGDVRVRGLERNSEPQVYLPYLQVEDGGFIGYTPKDLVIRTTTPTATILPAVRDLVNAADPINPSRTFRPWRRSSLGEPPRARSRPRCWRRSR